MWAIEWFYKANKSFVKSFIAGVTKYVIGAPSFRVNSIAHYFHGADLSRMNTLQKYLFVAPIVWQYRHMDDQRFTPFSYVQMSEETDSEIISIPIAHLPSLIRSAGGLRPLRLCGEIFTILPVS